MNEIRLIGISLNKKTTNENGQSAIDCGNLWQKFEKENIFAKIPGKVGDAIYAIYHEYEGDYTKPFSYFIGCAVEIDTNIPDGMNSLIIPPGNYHKFTAKGKMPDCIANTWREIWKSDIQRAYKTDFEIYDERSRDWNNAEVDIFISTK